MIQSMSMNRKQRRLQEKKAGKKTTKKVRDNAALVAEKKAQGMMLKNAGKEAEALPMLKDALRLDNSLADVHFALAMMAEANPDLKIDMAAVNKAVKDKTALQTSYQNSLVILKKRKQYEEALICQAELCRLAPDDLDEKGNLALLLALAGKKEQSLHILSEIMVADPANKKYKAAFASACTGVVLSTFDPIIKQALQIHFDNIYETNLLKAYMPWASLVILDPDCNAVITAEKIEDNQAFISWIEEAKPEDLTILQDRFFLDGLRLLILADVHMEKFLVRMRKWLCLNAQRLASENRLDFFEPFILALGEQCFFNEYVYEQSDEEKSAVKEVIEELESGELAALSETQAFALIGCYQCLYELFPDHSVKLKELSETSIHVSNLIKTQFFDPQREDELKKDLPAFGEMENAVSQNVQSQYEENPYPRWTSVINFAVPTDALPIGEEERLSRLKILVAGCGTGRHAIDTAATYPNAHVTAIDLSRSSLAYAKRKAQEAGLANRIDFIHADILNMNKWDGEFDIIESSGVLHHMEDPFKGWQILTSLLKSQGVFKIGLYSETARKAYVKAQDYAKEKSYPATLEGIRCLRRDILAMPTNTFMRELVTRSGDFYSTSLVRDLLFHVQEHRYNLLQIKDMMDRLGLTCARFLVSDVDTIRKYDKAYPQDINRSNMLNWHEFEQSNPHTFVGMYQFWCKKDA